MNIQVSGRRWPTVALYALVGLAALMSGRTPRASAGYSAAPTGTGESFAQLVPPGETPQASAFGRDITVSWQASALTGGTAASAYIVRRYSTDHVAAAVGAGCAGVISALSCVESAVPAGTWQYTVTPVLGGWTGGESVPSAPQATSAASLRLDSPTVATLPATLTGTIAGFVNGESLSFHLDGISGPTLAGSPSVVSAGGANSISVVIPTGTDDNPHSVFAVGSTGTSASHAIQIIDPPMLSSLQMLDVNGNGLIDRVVASFSKPLAPYTAGTTPWTLTNTPSGGTLTAVAVAGSTATLALNEGAGAPDTAVGAFTVSLAANAAGVRDNAGQTAQFNPTPPDDRAAPTVVNRQMFDSDVNGKVDRVTMLFSEPLAAYNAGIVPWTLGNVPSAGSLASVTVSASTATLTIAEGPGPVDTSVGSFTIGFASASGGIADSAGNVSSSTAAAPLDRAAPVRAAMSVTDTNGNGKIDYVVVTFSEPLDTYTAGTAPWTLGTAPSGATLASVAVGGSTATLTLNEGAGAATTAVGSFTIGLTANSAGVRDPAGNNSAFTAAAPADNAAPVLVSLSMNDSNGNGKVDQVTAVFTETLGTYDPTTAPWTTATVPSGGSLSSVSIATTTATLSFAEGAGTADTSVGSFTVALTADAGGVRDAAGNLASFTARAPLDTAKPAIVTLVMKDVNTNGRVDQVVATFSEPLAPYTAGTAPWTLTSAPSSATLGSIAVGSSTATLTLNEGAGAATTAVGSFKITLAANATGIRDAAANQSAFSSMAPSDGAAPVLLTLNMNDSSANGKVDQVTAVFTETLGSYTAATAPWTLSGVPSGGTLASVSVATTTATLTLNEGAGAADTTVGSFAVAMASDPNGVKDAAGNVSSFASTTPLDKSKPARLTMVMKDVDGNGKVDQVTLTFSEPLSTYTAATTPWTLASAPSSATLASVTVSGTSATLNLTEGTGAVSTALGSFKVTLAANAGGIRDAAANQSSFIATAPTDGAAPVLLTLSMLDTTANGKIDRVTAAFSETLTTYTAGTASWTLTNVPSSGTLASVAVSSSTATLTITEGAGAATTAVGSATVSLATNASGVRDAAGNLAAFTATSPLDKAAPARLSMVLNDTNANGKVDQLVVTFSEPLDPYTAGVAPWTLASAPSGATAAAVDVSGTTATITLAEGGGAANTAVGSFTVALATNAAGIRDQFANLTSFSAIAPTDKAAPVLVTLSMLDATANGKIDRVTAVFSETLTTYSAGTAPWTLTAIPSGGTLSSVTVATTTATLTIAEGAGAADTTTGSSTVALITGSTGVRDAAGNMSSFAATSPLDKAAPMRQTTSMFDTNGNGKVDQLVVTFSENLSTAYTAGATPWTLAAAPSGATVASVAIGGSTATVALTEGGAAPNTAVGSFTVALAANATGIRDSADNQSSFAAVAPTDKAAPALVSLTVTDTNANGKIDRVTAVFSESLSAYTAGNAPWTLAAVPSGGSLSSVAVTTTTATLTISEGAGAADTSIGSFTVALSTNAAGVRDAAANLSSFAATTPVDGAGPIATAITFSGGTTVGKIEPGDTMSIVFSEPVNPASLPSTATVSEADPAGAGNDTLTIGGVTLGARGTGADAYVGGDGTTADFAGSTITLINSNKTVVITVGPACENTGCASLGQGLTNATLSYAPAATITDSAGNPATGTRTDALRVF